jgi:N-acetylmuramoyl-L-alanine amidase
MLAGKRIVIDPGHGAPDPGAAYNGVREADVNLAVGLDVRTLLSDAGAAVTMTRTTDQSLALAGEVVDVDRDLQARVNVANQAAADLFVSLHSNVGEAGLQGAIAYYGAEGGFNSGARRTPRQVGLSVQLAADLAREIGVASGAVDRGIRPATFWVLGGTRAPAVLVEMGFLTNPDEAARLGSPAYQRRLAQGVVSGIARYFGTEDDAQFVADVTLPDGAQVFPGTPIIKTWRLHNAGLSTWGSGYRLAFSTGDRLGGPDSVDLPTVVPPGADVEVSVPLQAPAQDTAGPVSGWWQLRSPDGLWFGDRIWVSVQARTVLPTDRATRIDSPDERYYDATGHNLGYGFRSYFDAHGGLDRFGYPRTEEIQEDGWTVQYFQRARFEYHPEFAGTPYEVELGLLGDQLTTPRRPFPTVLPFADSADHHFAAETGHAIHFGFWRYFQERGGLDSFGYPISEEMSEGGLTVQYFQRARFEYHPEFAGTPYEVELGLLGDEYLRQRGWLR